MQVRINRGEQWKCRRKVQDESVRQLEYKLQNAACSIECLQHQVHVKMQNVQSKLEAHAKRSKRRDLHIQIQKYLHFFEPSMITEAAFIIENQKPFEIVNRILKE